MILVSFLPLSIPLICSLFLFFFSRSRLRGTLRELRAPGRVAQRRPPPLGGAAWLSDNGEGPAVGTLYLSPCVSFSIHLSPPSLSSGGGAGGGRLPWPVARWPFSGDDGRPALLGPLLVQCCPLLPSAATDPSSSSNGRQFFIYLMETF